MGTFNFRPFDPALGRLLTLDFCQRRAALAAELLAGVARSAALGTPQCERRTAANAELFLRSVGVSAAGADVHCTPSTVVQKRADVFRRSPPC